MNYFHLLFAFVTILVLSFFGGKLNTPQYCSEGSNLAIQNHSNTVPFENTTNSQVKTNEMQSSSLNMSNKALENIMTEEYNISYSEEIKSYQSPNRSNNIRFIYHNDGFTAETRESKIPLFDVNDKMNPDIEKKYKTIPKWEVNFKFNGYKRVSLKNVNENAKSQAGLAITDGSDCKKSLVPFMGNKLNVDKNKAVVEDENLKITYCNDEKGMRQDFIVKNRPEGSGRLSLVIEADTKLDMKIKSDELKFNDNSGDEKINYSGLKVWDANGKILAANFEESYSDSENDGGSFAIVIDDEQASYPVTVDPISSSPNWTSESNQAGSGFGYSVSSAGDVNNDGYDDVIIGAPFYDNGYTNEGKAFVYQGSLVGLLPVALWTAKGNQDYAQFGWSVSKAGDVNNDGFDDVVIGANLYTNDLANEGKAYIYYGSLIGLSATPNWTAEGNQTGCQFGWIVSSAGDINNDGYSDVIVGAPLYDSVLSDRGRVFVYYGSHSTPNTNANWKTQSDQTASFFGITAVGAGDINGDGFDDIVVGANKYDNPLYDEGGAFVYFGSSAGLSNNISWRSETHHNAWFAYYGISVAAAGDVNNDGYADLIVGAYAMDNGETDEGVIFGYYGSPTGFSSVANWTGEINQAYARLGCSVASAGDVNNDGYSDVIVGAKEYDNGQTDEGGAFIFYGSQVGLTSPAFWKCESNQINANLGNSVASAGDVNGDGFSDVIVGAYPYDNGQVDEGRAFVYYGTIGGPKTLQMTVYIQGLYNNVANNTKTDTVKVRLRNSFPPYAIVDSAKATINSAGVGNYSFMNALNGVNYYFEVTHRNSNRTWSSSAQSFIGGFKTYNFTTAANKALGNNMVQVDASPVAFAMYSGDINLDNNIELADMLFVYNDATNFVTGNVITDLNGDNLIDLQDLLFASNNAANFVSVYTP